MLPGKKQLLLGFVSVIWLMSLISLYYVWHKPFSADLALQAMRSFWHLGVALAITTLSGGLGKWILGRRSGFKGMNPLVLMVIEVNLGIGLLSVLFLVVGTMIGISPLVSWGGLFALGLLLRRSLWEWWQSFKGMSEIWQKGGRFTRCLFVGVGLIGAVALAAALAPPLAWDALVYHLALPRYYHLLGRIAYVPWLMFWGMPQTGEMLYTWAFSLAGAEAATVVGWFFGILAISGLMGYVYERFGDRAALVAVASLLSGYTLAASLAWGYVDWLTLLSGVGVLATLDLWGRRGDREVLVVAGALAGIGLGSKYTAGVLIISGLAVIVWLGWGKKPFRILLSDLISFSVVASLLSLPWWIKNALATGNPFYPFFLPTEGMDSFRLNFYGLHPWGDWKEALLLPFRATITGVEGKEGYSASIGPLLLSLSVFSWIGWPSCSSEERNSLRIAASISLMGLLVWMVAGRIAGMLIQSRLYFCVFPAMATLAGVGFIRIEQIRWQGLRFGRIVGALILVVFGFSVLEVAQSTLKQGVPEVLFGLSSEKEYLSRNLGWYPLAMEGIRDLPEGAKVKMLWEPRSYYCLPKCHPDEIIDRWKHALFLWKDADTILQEWRSEGYTHLLFNRFHAHFVRETDSRYSPTDWATLDELLARLPPPLDFGGVYLLYSLTP